MREHVGCDQSRNVEAAPNNLGCMPVLRPDNAIQQDVLLPVKADGLLVLDGSSPSHQDWPAMVFVVKDTEPRNADWPDMYATHPRLLNALWPS